MQTQIRLLPKEQSEQGLHCLSNQHPASLGCTAQQYCLIFSSNYVGYLWCSNILNFHGSNEIIQFIAAPSPLIKSILSIFFFFTIQQWVKNTEKKQQTTQILVRLLKRNSLNCIYPVCSSTFVPIFSQHWGHVTQRSSFMQNGRCHAKRGNVMQKGQCHTKGAMSYKRGSVTQKGPCHAKGARLRNYTYIWLLMNFLNIPIFLL